MSDGNAVPNRQVSEKNVAEIARGRRTAATALTILLRDDNSEIDGSALLLMSYLLMSYLLLSSAIDIWHSEQLPG